MLAVVVNDVYYDVSDNQGDLRVRRADIVLRR
jgi:hypothetical protein